MDGTSVAPVRGVEQRGRGDCYKYYEINGTISPINLQQTLLEVPGVMKTGKKENEV